MLKAILFFLVSFSAMATQYLVDTIKNKEGMDFSYILENSKENKYKLEIDCQSFIHTVSVFDQDKKVFENMIEEYECEEVMENTDLCLRHNQNKCIDLNDITDPNCECR